MPQCSAFFLEGPVTPGSISTAAVAEERLPPEGSAPLASHPSEAATLPAVGMCRAFLCAALYARSASVSFRPEAIGVGQLVMSSFSVCVPSFMTVLSLGEHVSIHTFGT